MVTAKGEESDVVLGLGMGADDYVVKPFSPKELVARVKAVLRRSRAAPEKERKDRIARDGIVIDPQRHDVRVDGESVVLTATEFRLLHFLASHPGRVFTRDQLLTRVIGEEAIVIDRNIDVHVRAIREAGEHRQLIGPFAASAAVQVELRKIIRSRFLWELYAGYAVVILAWPSWWAWCSCATPSAASSTTFAKGSSVCGSGARRCRAVSHGTDSAFQQRIRAISRTGTRTR
jgi:hypothetical protein